MENWRSKKVINYYLKLQKSEKLYWILTLLNAVIMSTTIYLFMLFSWLEQNIAANSQSLSKELSSILEFASQSLHLLIVISIFIGVFTLLFLQYFRFTKNRRRNVILNLSGLNSHWRLYTNIFESLLITVVSSVLGFWGARQIFIITARRLIGMERIPIVTGLDMLLQVIGVFIWIFSLTFFSVHIANLSEYHKSLGEQLRGGERKKNKDEKEKSTYYLIFFVLLYSSVLFIISNHIQTMIIGTIALIVICFCSYVFGRYLLLVANEIMSFYNRKRSNGFSISRLVFGSSGTRKEEKSLLITIMSIGLCLLFLLSSIEWGMKGFLERLWLENQQMNIYLSGEIIEEDMVEKFLSENLITYRKLYVKELTEERIILAVSDCNDEASSFYVQRGYFKTIPYNLYRWNMEAGEDYDLQGKVLLLDEAMEEKAFQLINYTALVHYEDWKELIDESYTAVFGIHVETNNMPLIASFAADKGIGLMTSDSYITMVKQVYSQYLDMLEVILIFILLSIFLFIFVSILSSVMTRRREFFLYRGCGGSWSDIRKIILMEYAYVTFLGICVSSGVFLGIFNLFKLVWLNNQVAYFISIWQFLFIMFFITLIVCIECWIVIRALHLKNNTLYFRE